MQLTTALTTLLLGAASTALATPIAADSTTNPSFEHISISNYTITTLGGQVTYVSFRLSGLDAIDLLCREHTFDSIPAEKAISCSGSSVYSFNLVYNKNETSGYGQQFYHAYGTAVGLGGAGAVPTKCWKFEENGPVTCTQEGDFAATLH